MTNPDSDELVKLADWCDAGVDMAVSTSTRSNFKACATALRRLASSDGGVKGDMLSVPFNPCLAKLRADEPFFVLLGRDKQAPLAVMTWADAREAAEDHSPWVDQAREVAATMATYSGVEVPAVKGEPEPVVDWRDDPTSDERWNAGCDFAMTQLCKALDVDPAAVNWDAATETVDGDVQSVIWNILRARMGEDWDPDTASPADAGMREALESTFDNILSRVFVFRDHEPEEDETWESWYYAAFDMLGAEIREMRKTALTAPGATTKSDGGESAASGNIIVPPKDFARVYSAINAAKDVLRGYSKIDYDADNHPQPNLAFDVGQQCKEAIHTLDECNQGFHPQRRDSGEIG